jgi:hypothetical protein
MGLGMGHAEVTGWWCRHCGQPVRLEGAGEPEMRKAVHAATGRERGPDTHLAAPQDTEPPLWASARRLEAEFGGAFTIEARFGFLRADWARRAVPGGTPVHTEARSEDEMRRKLDIEVAGTRWERGAEPDLAAASGGGT